MPIGALNMSKKMDKKQALIDAYLAGARAHTHHDMVSAVKLAKELEKAMTQQEIDAAKLEAELELEKNYRPLY